MNIRKIFGFCSACIAFYIGAGFATMQEVMQYEASYGSQFWIVIVVTAIIYIYTNYSFITNGNKYKTTNGGDIYSVYCGKYIGKVFEYFAAFFCYMCFIVMCGGANSTAIEQWGLPNGVGAIILAALAVIAVVFGLESILKYLKGLGTVIILFIIIIAVVSICIYGESFSEGMSVVDSHKYNITQVGNGNPWASGVSYGGFVILWFATFLGEIGAKNNVKEIKGGMLLSTLAIFGVASLCCIALISSIDVTWNVGVPALALAQQIHPLLAKIFAFIIFLGIFTSAIPLLWTGIRKISDEGTPKYRWLTIVGGIIGCLVACFVQYKGLLNVLYGINGYLGFILVAFMLFHDFMMILNKNKR